MPYILKYLKAVKLIRINVERKQFAKDLEKRTRIFAVQIIRLSSALNNMPEAIVIRHQITKSGTSIGKKK